MGAQLVVAIGPPYWISKEELDEFFTIEWICYKFNNNELLTDYSFNHN